MSELDKSIAIGVIGAGTMGAGIAQIAAKHGHSVYLFDQNQDTVSLSLKKMRSGLERLISRGKITEAEIDNLINRIKSCDKLEQLSSCGLVIEAIVENLEIKQTVFKQLENLCSKNTILATNTSSISITAIGEKLQRPENLVGMHFFNPAPIMKLVEVISGLATSKQVETRVADTATAWGKEAVLAKSTPGFIANRVARPFYAESLRLLEEGAASTATLDALMREAAGFRMGPFELMDLIGHDINYSVTESVFNAFYQDKRFLPSLIQKELVAGGFLGRKTGRGFYEYGDDSEKPAPEQTTSSFKPNRLTVEGDLGTASALLKLAENNGINIDTSNGSGFIHCGESVLALTDGRTATKRSLDEDIPNLILFDLQRNYAEDKRIAIAPALQASKEALEHAIGFFNSIGKTVSVIMDAPGLCVMRTISMLANEGADAVHHGVCEISAVDNAMLYGLNYPKGPMAWADIIGLEQVCTVLDNLQTCYGIDRYRTSLLLQQYADSGKKLYE